ncbi:MAG: hypothetical protein M3R24_28180, partial [Chloroflexota bacterium]|nr:hypothetical protein [Chloroflexota bacterium]
MRSVEKALESLRRIFRTLRAATTSASDRKQLVRLAIQDVTVTVRTDQARSADVAVLWSGGT